MGFGRTVMLMLVGSFFALAPATQAAAQSAAEKGATVFAAQKCSLCHSLDGKGNPKGPLDNIGSTLSADDIRQWIVNSAEMAKKHKAERKPPMKSYASLPKEDVDALVAFLTARKKL